MDIIIKLLEALVLGIVQGLTEFLPVSSSAHLEVLPWLFGWVTPGKVFDTSLHLGTSLALLSFFYADFLGLLKSIIPSNNMEVKERKRNHRLLSCILIAMLPAGIIGVLFDKQLEQTFSVSQNPSAIYVTVIMLVFFGVLLFMVDRYGKHTRTIGEIRYFDALIVGIFQLFALIPGVSRSGSTMTAAMAGGFNRESAARFSFLVGTPITLAAGLYKLKDFAEIPLTTNTVLYFIVGIAASAISGYFCIKFFLHFLQSKGVAVFTIYRIILALIILSVFLSR